MSQFLYTIFIYPVYMFVELIFFIANNITDDYTGLSIVILSIAVNLICLPMYAVAEQWQEKERAIQKKLKPKLNDIKAVFKGDERYMIVSTYYRQNNYHPIYALRGTFALLIQIPFFIAAYTLLSHLPVLKNTSFLFLNNLGSPDGLLHIGGRTVNMLPLVMTFINILAAAVYAKGLELKEKIQLYTMPLLFLVLLYYSPSGLVLYWTLNNVFSLFKNIFYRLHLSRKIGYWLIVFGFAAVTILMMQQGAKLRQLIIVQSITGMLIAVPLIVQLLVRAGAKYTGGVWDDDKKRFSSYLLAVTAFCMFIGLVVPSATIASSPLEFIHFEGIHNPFQILYHTLIQSVGILFWSICLYMLFGKSIQKIFLYIAVIILTAALMNAFIFQDPYSNINNLLIFEDAGKLRHSFREILTNLITVGLAACAVTALLSARFLCRAVTGGLQIVILSFAVLTGLSGISILKELKGVDHLVSAEKTDTKAYRVTRTGKNIFIFMLDRSMNFFIDSIFEHSDIVRKEYTGFTLFTNAVAFGMTTNISTPSLFGGYEYTPDRINQRSDELLVNKHNEALSTLPRLFSENGWNVSFTDPPWLNYRWIPDLSVFAQYDMRTKNIDSNGVYTPQYLAEHGSGTAERQTAFRGIRRNMLYFSLFRALPMEARRIFYANGMYGGVDIPIYSAAFINAYSALENIDKEVAFVDDKDCLNIILNNVPHEPPKAETLRLFEKDFLIPLGEETCLNTVTAEHFYANYLAHESCAKFFRFLKEQGCWDNSRIIIIGDHGTGSIHTKSMKFIEAFDTSVISPQRFIPLMMMKDFNEEGVLHTDSSFMTLADVPILATQGLPESLGKNPFTGIPFVDSRKKDAIKIVLSADWNANHQLHLTQFKDAEWGFVKDNVYDPSCWSKTGFAGKEEK